ncbi:MAG: hypothetical protein ACPG4K_08190 [Haloferula sp.]
MKLEGEYAVCKGQRAHRFASALVYLIWIALVFSTGGLGHAFKAAAYYLLPMACIWFPDAMGNYTGALWARGPLVDERSHPTFLRWAGWFLLLVVPILIGVRFFVRG